MTRWVFTGKHVDDYIDPQPEAFKPGAFMYNTHANQWYRCMRKGPAPKENVWWMIPEWDVPKVIRAKMLLLE